MIAQDFGFARNFLKERNNSAYFRLKKIPCGFKQQARARHTGEKCGLDTRLPSGFVVENTHPVAAVLLGLVKRDVRLLYQQRTALVVNRYHRRNSDANRHVR